MGFWTNCKECGNRIYMALVTPPDEYDSRWLPFEDESLTECHLNRCTLWREPEIKKEKNVKQYQKLQIYNSPTPKSRNSPTPHRTKNLCPYCNKKMNNLDQHISVKHPDKWNEYSKKTNVIERLKKKKGPNLQRCNYCGMFTRKLDKHIPKCPQKNF